MLSKRRSRVVRVSLKYLLKLKNERYTLELPRYSDKYRPTLFAQPTLKRKELHEPFFPAELLEGYFNPKRRKTSTLFPW